ncbi:MAG: DivIVA domain-containing protein [Pseudonocardiales bacterium]|nr:DivIVA domain-containing protein [Pseudonocardiales bacterium]
MPLTPAEVRNVVFGKSPIGKQGYNEDQVDTFLDLVEAELARLIAENDDLRRRLEQLDRQQGGTRGQTGSGLGPELPHSVMAAPSPRADQRAPESDPHAHAARVLGLAQEMADRLTSQAKTEADAMLSQARTQADELLAAAKAKADGLVQEARARAETLLTDARTTAETLERQSREKTAAREREAAHQHSQTMAALNHEKNTLENAIDRLRALEQEYRTRLKAYLTAQLHELDEDDTVPPSALRPNRQGVAAFGPSTPADTGSR